MRLTSDGRSEWSDNPRIPNSDADKMMKMFALYHKNLFRFISHTIIHNLTHFFWLFRFDRSTHAHATVIHFTSISRLQSIMMLLTHSTHTVRVGEQQIANFMVGNLIMIFHNESRDQRNNRRWGPESNDSTHFIFFFTFHTHHTEASTRTVREDEPQETEEQEWRKVD